MGRGQRTSGCRSRIDVVFDEGGNASRRDILNDCEGGQEKDGRGVGRRTVVLEQRHV